MKYLTYTLLIIALASSAMGEELQDVSRAKTVDIREIDKNLGDIKINDRKLEWITPNITCGGFNTARIFINIIIIKDKDVGGMPNELTVNIFTVTANDRLCYKSEILTIDKISGDGRLLVEVPIIGDKICYGISGINIDEKSAIVSSTIYFTPFK